MKPVALLQRLFDLLLRLYPRRFQEQFGEEMRSVFTGLIEQERPRGTMALLTVFLRELSTAPRSLAGAYRLNFLQGRRKAVGWAEGPAAPLEPAGPEPSGGGRRDLQQVILDLALFILLGGALLVHTYLLPALPPGSIRTAFLVSSWAAAFLPFPIFLIGLAQGMPRWAYPSAGLLLGYLFIAGLAFRILALIALLLLGALGLILVSAWAQRRYRCLPQAVLRIWEGLAQDWGRISFGLYGLLPPAILLAFDDGFVNYRTPYLGAAVLIMLAGAVGYSLSRRPALQAAALLAGISGMAGMALLDRAFFGSGLETAGWLLRLWGNLALLALVPFGLELFSRGRRAARPL